ncbi:MULTISPECIES: hypothetical protein [unclassified Marinovum]
MSQARRRIGYCAFVVTLGAACASVADTTPAPPMISSALPLGVTVPSTVSSAIEARPFFDQFSWQSFIALNWPADPNAPGAPLDPNDPSTFTSAAAGTPTVWESYATSYRLFGSGQAEPPAFGTGPAEGDPCSANTKTLRMVAKGADITGNTIGDVNEAFSHPLIDQNLNYVYAEVRFNDAYYDFVRSNGYYLKRNLSAAQQPLQMPESVTSSGTIGAMMIKAAWRQMTAKDDTSRYHVITASVVDPDGGGCSQVPMGLVGLHIAQKAEGFPEWIWSSFEQVDNVTPGPGASETTPVSFNNGTDTPATPRGWANRPPIAPPLLAEGKREATQVTRLNPIPTTPAGMSTVDQNATYAELLKGTPWAHYQLVITQWPTDPGTFKLPRDGGVYPKDAGGAFPANGATNTAMETYFQSQEDAAGAGGNSCMSCHYAASTSDFSWILFNQSH